MHVRVDTTEAACMSDGADLVMLHSVLQHSSGPVAANHSGVLLQPSHEPDIQLQHLQGTTCADTPSPVVQNSRTWSAQIQNQRSSGNGNSS